MTLIIGTNMNREDILLIIFAVSSVIDTVLNIYKELIK